MDDADDIRKAVTELKSRTFAQDAYERVKIWWLASYPKSGNTWLRAFLSAYSRGGTVNINSLTPLGDMKYYFYQAVSPLPIDKLSVDEILLIRPAALFHLACCHGNPYTPLLLKTHSLFNPYLLIPPAITNGAIYLVRDPRDVAVSYAKHVGTPIDAAINVMADERANIADYGAPVFQQVSSWSINVESWLNANPVNRLVVRYEDMLATPFEAFSSIVKFLQYEYNEETLSKAIDATTFKNLQEQEQKYGFTEHKMGDQFFNQGKAGHWKDVLTKKQQKQIESDHKEIMQTLGYL